MPFFLLPNEHEISSLNHTNSSVFESQILIVPSFDTGGKVVHLRYDESDAFDIRMDQVCYGNGQEHLAANYNVQLFVLLALKIAFKFVKFAIISSKIAAKFDIKGSLRLD